ncbi:hypothetical protein HGRIS_007634 [Hohenbuehelia grisea]|uniref:WD40 repeat-like protein n=1 Tax=Hohenbuehelia grisea TaxID=104357 RepID=A0ABR3J6U7_9AGAR
MAEQPASLAVHRCRFVDYTPSPVTALAFPPLPLSSAKGKKSSAKKPNYKFSTLAVGHANGNIDLCEWAGTSGQVQCSQAWVVRKTLAGPYPSKVDSLAFVLRDPETIDPERDLTYSDLRLFSSGGGSDLLEWDLERGCVKRSIDSQGGSIWSMAPNPACTMLALGCEDGTVRLFSLAFDGLAPYRKFDRVKCRILSVAWGPPIPRATPASRPTDDNESSDDDEDEWTDSWIVTGGSDSSLRKWEVATGRAIDRFTVDKMRGERTLVWTVGVLGDGTIISGDSLGMVKFWDSRTCTQLQSFQAHAADVLCLTVSPEGTAVYTSGVDQKIIQFSFVKSSAAANGAVSAPRTSSRWIQSSSRRMHSHDVRALAIWPPYTPLPPSHRQKQPIDIAPILASGGLDMSVVLTPAALPSSTVVKITNPLDTSTHATFEDAYHRKLPYTTGPSSVPPVCAARAARLICCMRETGLSIWRVHPERVADVDPLLDAPEAADGDNWERVLDMELNVHTNLLAIKLSDDGRWLAVADLYETRLFLLEPDANGSLKPKRVKNFTATIKPHLSDKPESTGALAFAFSPDSSKLILSSAFSARILVLELDADEKTATVLRHFDQHRLRNTRVTKGRQADADADVEMADADAGEDGTASEDEGERNEEDEVVTTSVRHIAVSVDGQWLATSDDLSRTHVFNLDTLQHHCVLPSFPQSAQTIAFDPQQPSIFIMAFPNNTLQIYNVETRQFPAWSKDLCATLPYRLTHAHDPIAGITFEPTTTSTDTSESAMAVDVRSPRPRYALLWGSTWIFKLNLDAKDDGAVSRKRRRESIKLAAGQPAPADVPATAEVEGAQDSQSTPRGNKMITNYRPLLFVDFLAHGELVVVERPVVDVLATLPPAFFKPKYGRS